MVSDDEATQQPNGNESGVKLGDKWGNDITPEREAELEARLQKWASESDHGKKRGPFDGDKLTGADVFWLVLRTEPLNAKEDYKPDVSPFPSALHLEGANLRMAHLEEADLTGAHLEGTDLSHAHLSRAYFTWAHLEGANLSEAHLEGADLLEAHLEGANFWGAHLEGADLVGAHLEGTDFTRAHLEGANLTDAHLEGTDFWEAHLEGANLTSARLKGKRFAVNDSDLLRIRQWISEFPSVLTPAVLYYAFFDRASQLTDVTLGDADLGYVGVANTHWGDVNLAVVDWGENPVLRDERVAREWKPAEPDADEKDPTRQEKCEALRKQRNERLKVFREAIRANRQLAAVLRDQGLNDIADKFAYRARVLQRTVLRLRDRHGAAFGSWLLDLVSGYGYEPARSVAAYIIIVVGFALAYYAVAAVFVHISMPPLAALVFSVTSFHGRGFMPGENVALTNPLTVLAAIEAIIGLLIEITFIATFTQRFFAR